MINQYDINGKYIQSFSKIMDAAKSVDENWRVTYPCIHKVCCGKAKTACGFQWKIADDTSDIEPCIKKTRRLNDYLNQYSSDGTYLHTYTSVTEAIEQSGVTRGIIYYATRNNTLGGQYQWRFMKSYNTENIAPYQEKRRKPYSVKNHSGGKSPKKVHQYSRQGKYVRTFDNCSEASRFMHIDACTISCSCKTGHICGESLWIADSDTEKLNCLVPLLDKQICQYDENGHFLQFYSSMVEAAIFVDTNVVKLYHAVTKNKKARGFFWRITDNTEDIEIEKPETPAKPKKRKGKQFNQYRKDGTYIRSFQSVTEASEIFGINVQKLYWANRTEKELDGFLWRITEDTSDLK